MWIYFNKRLHERPSHNAKLHRTEDQELAVFRGVWARTRRNDSSTHSFKSPMYHQSFCGSVYTPHQIHGTLGQTFLLPFFSCCCVSFRLLLIRFNLYFSFIIFMHEIMNFSYFFSPIHSLHLLFSFCYSKVTALFVISNTIGGILCIFKNCTNCVCTVQLSANLYSWLLTASGAVQQPIYDQDPKQEHYPDYTNFTTTQRRFFNYIIFRSLHDVAS